ncbi:hypothetical protein SGPA1_30105 [Streptomyces misionensis JCM 4497]
MAGRTPGDPGVDPYALIPPDRPFAQRTLKSG